MRQYKALRMKLEKSRVDVSESESERCYQW